MKLKAAVEKIVAQHGAGENVDQIVEVLKKFGAPDNVPDRTLKAVLAAGTALRAMGIR